MTPTIISYYTNPPHSHGDYCASRELPRGTKILLTVNNKKKKWRKVLIVDDKCGIRGRIDLASRFGFRGLTRANYRVIGHVVMKYRKAHDRWEVAK